MQKRTNGRGPGTRQAGAPFKTAKNYGFAGAEALPDAEFGALPAGSAGSPRRSDAGLPVCPTRFSRGIPARPLSLAPVPTAATRLVALLGDPVAHSRSPALHNAAFRALGIDAVYLACRIDAADLPAALDGLDALGALGANVTIPHKEAAARHLAHRGTLTDAARAIGAVNTVVRRSDGRFEGDNTDADGFLDGLAPHRGAVDGAEAVVFGVGGAARAVAVALMAHVRPSRLTLVARDTARADAVARALAPVSNATPVATDAFGTGTVREAVRRARLVVNATPLGMAPNALRTPHPDADDLGPDHVVYDLVYAPRETRLLREAAARGAATVCGLAMLAGQADRAFRRWTGKPIPPDVLSAWAETA